MAINLQLSVKVDSGFNAAIATDVRNGITVGGRSGTVNGATDVNSLEGNLPEVPAPMAQGQQFAMREDGDQGAVSGAGRGGAAGGRRHHRYHTPYSEPGRRGENATAADQEQSGAAKNPFGPMPSGTDTPLGEPRSGGAAYLAARRAPFRRELDQHPETRRLLGAIVSAENPGAGPGVAESLMNRTELVNEHRAQRGLPPLGLRDMIVGHPSIGGGHSFYGPMRNGAINSHFRNSAAMQGRIDQALAGSNVIRGHTDQGSAGDPNYSRGGVGVNINGERFNNWGFPGSEAFQQRSERGYAAAEQAARIAAANPHGTSGAHLRNMAKRSGRTITFGDITQGHGEGEAQPAAPKKMTDENTP